MDPFGEGAMKLSNTCLRSAQTTYIGPRITEIYKIFPSLCQCGVRVPLRTNDEDGYKRCEPKGTVTVIHLRFMSPGSPYNIHTGVNWSTKCTSKLPSAHSALGRDPIMVLALQEHGWLVAY